MELSGAHSPCRSLVCCFMQMYGRMLTKNRSFSLTGASVKACLISAYASNMKSLMSIFTDALPSSEGGNGKWRLKGVFIESLKLRVESLKMGGTYQERGCSNGRRPSLLSGGASRESGWMGRASPADCADEDVHNPSQDQ